MLVHQRVALDPLIIKLERVKFGLCILSHMVLFTTILDHRSAHFKTLSEVSFNMLYLDVYFSQLFIWVRFDKVHFFSLGHEINIRGYYVMLHFLLEEVDVSLDQGSVSSANAELALGQHFALAITVDVLEAHLVLKCQFQLEV